MPSRPRPATIHVMPTPSPNSPNSSSAVWRIPGLILTGETDLEFQRTAASNGLGIAHKPVTPSQLGRVLDQQLNAAA